MFCSLLKGVIILAYEKFIVPKNISVSTHAAMRYLTRVLEIPLTPRKIQAARLFLTYKLGNRAYSVREWRQDCSAERLKLIYRGLYFIYDKKDRRVYSVYPNEYQSDKLEMKMSVPADFIVEDYLKFVISKNTLVKLYREEWPVYTARGTALRLKVNKWLVDVDIMRRKVTKIIEHN